MLEKWTEWQNSRVWEANTFVIRLVLYSASLLESHSNIACLFILFMQPEVTIDLTITHAQIVALERKLQASKTNNCYTHSPSHTTPQDQAVVHVLS